MCLPISSVIVRTIVGQLLLDAGVHGLAHARRQVVPELRVLALHDPLDHVADVAARGRDDVLGDLLGVELLVEVAGVPSLAIPLSTAIEPIFAAREGTIPCQPRPPCMSPGICWILRGSTLASARRPGTLTPAKRTG